MALPKVIGKAFRDQLLRLSGDDVAAMLRDLDLPAEALARTRDNLLVVEWAVRRLPADSVLSGDAAWQSTSTDRALGVVSIDEELQRARFPALRVLESWNGSVGPELADRWPKAIAGLNSACARAASRSLVAGHDALQSVLHWRHEMRRKLASSDELPPIYAGSRLDAYIERCMERASPPLEPSLATGETAATR